jgi:membrane-associated protease RseP (regulator of RpoE activity)
MANLFEFPNMTSGVDDILIDLSMEVVAFPIMLLVSTWIIIFVGGMTAQARNNAYADAPMWSTIAFLTVTLMGLVMTVATGIINPIVLGVLFGGTLFSALWLFLSRGRFEN